MENKAQTPPEKMTFTSSPDSQFFCPGCAERDTRIAELEDRLNLQDWALTTGYKKAIADVLALPFERCTTYYGKRGVKHIRVSDIEALQEAQSDGE